MDLQYNGYHYINLPDICKPNKNLPYEHQKLHYNMTICQKPIDDKDIIKKFKKAEYIVQMCAHNCYYNLTMNQIFEKYKNNIPESLISNNNIFANVNR
tara:strand:+ start:96 stop:389 length:294 start_codon:yes stop_codon:yes gene_type:complete